MRPVTIQGRSPWAQRWYGPLVAEVEGQLVSVIGRLEREDCLRQASPRTGLGGALALVIARRFGKRAAPRQAKLAALALEGYDGRLFAQHHDIPASERFGRDLARARAMFAPLVSESNQRPILDRALDRLMTHPTDQGDVPVPECVAFLRAAVAAGVVVGEVDDALHSRLDAWAVHAGICWELAHTGQVCIGAGGLLGPGAHQAPTTASAAGAEAGLAFSELASELGVDFASLGQASASLLALVRRCEATPPEAIPARAVVAWTPQRLRAPTRPTQGHTQGQGNIALERALCRVVESRSQVFSEATLALVHAGGKRVRPRMVLAVCEALGGDPRRALPAAAAVEWLHNASLVVDDLIDQASLRRGKETLHRQTSPQFALGVAGFVLARVQVACRGLHPDARAAIADAALTLADGERQELERTADFSLGRTDYYRIIENKTGRLFSCAAQVGAIEAGASRGRRALAKRFGHQAGLAFQIVDDVLDYQGKTTALGKEPGVDLRARKVTLPIIELRERLAGPQRGRLQAAIETGTDLQWIVGQIETHAIAEACLSRAETHLDVARAAARSLDGGVAGDGDGDASAGPVARLLAGWLERTR